MSRRVSAVPRIPLIEDLTSQPLAVGSQLLVEYDPSSQWYNASITIAGGWLKTGGNVRYCTFTRPPDDVRSKFTRIGLDTSALERSEDLVIYDLYSATLGKRSTEKRAVDSLKAADWSVRFLQEEMPALTPSDLQSSSKHLTIVDDNSTFARFNEEKAWVELELTRIIPSTKLRKMTYISSLMTDVHSRWVYKRLESAMDGVIDFRLNESDATTRDMIRIRMMSDTHFDRAWHELKLADNFEVTLEK
jgi:KaiC/GvpD/RAD55 family RecA-like ATPase